MPKCYPETKLIASLILDKHFLDTLNNIANGIEKNINYDVSMLWNLQEQLIPYHPHHSIKNFMTPIQCAKDEIEICNINYNSTYVILYCSKYLEEIIRYFLSMLRPVMKFKYRLLSFGNLIKKLENYDFLPKAIVEALNQIYILNSRAQSEQEAQFKAMDAITVYICSLIIGCRLLELSDQRLKVSESKCLDNFYKVNAGD
ncbi:hypothetical protein [Clostridium thermarum]|uniref:hypothetical protein n=1 Tax=Clostridium thermarum TaxID=1716543 RepID=UPI0013D34232|nr:hypothetical protein [Clostridium thermarum]